mgnify:CR=1 FL=1
MKKLIRNKKLPCKKCKVKDSIDYSVFDDGNEVAIILSPCVNCSHETNFSEIFKYL